MKSKILGVDIDGVVTDESEYEKGLWHYHFCQFLGRNVERNENIYNIYEAYDIDNDIINDFLGSIIPDIYHMLEPVKMASKVLDFLYKKGFTIKFITARSEEYKRQTQSWLMENGFPFDKLIHSEEKDIIAKEENVGVFIEDYADNAYKIAENRVEVILLDKKYNRHLEHNDNIYRVKNWDQIKNIILDLYNIT